MARKAWLGSLDAPRVALAILCLVAATMAGCAGGDSTLRVAFVQPDDATEPAKHPERLAKAIQEATGRKTRLYLVESTELALEAVGAGQADAAFVDGAAGWYGWKRLGLEAVAASLEGDGRPHYIASAWVLTNSSYASMEDLRGADSCHTGLLKSAGTFMPLGWLIANGLVERVGPDDVVSIAPTLDAFFGTPNIPASDADPYGGYGGALRCLSEGVGDVAFLKDTSVTTFCGPQPREWCRPWQDYRVVQNFGRVPSHPVMVGDLGTSKRNDLVAGLLELTKTTQGLAVLKDVLGSNGMVAVGTEAHLGEYSANVQHVPGMMQYVASQVR